LENIPSLNLCHKSPPEHDDPFLLNARTQPASINDQVIHLDSFFSTGLSCLLIVLSFFLNNVIMKKIAILAILVFFFVVSAYSQVTKGNWMVGGTIGLTSDKMNQSDAEKETVTQFTFAPQAGYFIIDKFAAGLRFDIMAETDKVHNPVNSYSTAQTDYAFGPFLRYYFLSPEKMANVFFEAGDQYFIGVPHNGTSITYTSNDFNIAAGPVIFLNSSVGLEWSIGYTWTKGIKNVGGTKNSFQTGIGLQIHLEKDDKDILNQ
jgi:hypothetical protein